MFRRMLLVIVAAALSCALGDVALAQKKADKTIEFTADDGLTITADVYFKDEDDRGLPFICLFHQANFSRGEYLEIAPRLVELGYNCMAVDARSGKGVNKVDNETAKRAAEAKKGQDYEHAIKDVVAALQYARENFADDKLIAWGSSYSASLVLKASAENEGLVNGSLSFSPNDVAKWTRDWILEDAEAVKHPVFITSAKAEQNKWERLKEKISESQRTEFIPVTSGRHGSRALWKAQRDSDAYWTAVEEFLTTNFPPTPTPPVEVAATPERPGRPAAQAAPAAEGGKQSLLGRFFGGGKKSDAAPPPPPAQPAQPTEGGHHRGHSRERPEP